MTAVMRAVTPAQGLPRVLRVGLFVEGRIVEERIVPRATDVTVGSGEKATFVVPGVPAHHALFVHGKDGYRLDLAPGMSARLVTLDGPVHLGTAGATSSKLDEWARGKVSMGDATLLFQFVTPPPVQPRPQLPLSVKQGLLAQIDWTLTIIAAISFLLHFGIVGQMYSDWGDTVVGDDLTVTLAHVVPPPATPPVVESTEPVASVVPTSTATPSATTTARPAPTTANRPSPEPANVPNPPLVSGLVSELQRLHIEAIGGIHGGPNLGIVTATSDTPPVNLNDLYNRETSIDNRRSGLDLPPGNTAPIVPGRPTLDGFTGLPGTAPSASVVLTTPRVVPMDVHEDPPMTTGTVRNAEAVIRQQIHPGARRCYQSGLASNGDQQGKLMVMLRVGPSGEVDSATVQSNTGLSPQVTSCVLTVSRNAKFDPPGPSGASILVPFSFLKSGG
jgi:hypothetical protein